MAIVMAVRRYIAELAERGDRHASDCEVAFERSAEISAQLSAAATEKAGLIGELNSPGFREQRHRAAGIAVADGVEPEDVGPTIRDRLREIDEQEPALNAALVVLGERYEKALRAATGKFVKELQPTNIANVKACVIAALDLRAVADTERAWRGPLMQDGVPFSGTLQGMPPNFAQPGAQLDIWLRRVARHFPAIDVHRLAKQRGIEL